MRTPWEDSVKGDVGFWDNLRRESSISQRQIVLEIPHQGKPLAWFAIDEKDFQNKLISGFTHSEEEYFYELLHEGVEDEGDVNEVTTDQLLDIAGSDLSRFIVFDTIDEARNYALVSREQGFWQVYKVLSDWDLLIYQISIKENESTVYEYFYGNDDVSTRIYSMLTDDQHLSARILGVDHVNTECSVLAEVIDLDIEQWQEEIWGEQAE